MRLREVEVLYPRVYEEVKAMRQEASKKHNFNLQEIETKLQDESYIRDIYRLTTNISKLERFNPVRTKQLELLIQTIESLQAYYTAFIIREQLHEQLR